jgi:hypothetical protein
MSKPLDFDKIIKKIAETGGRVQPRMVSYKEYKILEKMYSEGKTDVDVMGYPKSEFFDEYCKLMKESE